MATDRANTGVLWNVKEKKGDKSPDMTGDILLDAATLAALAKNGGKLSVAAWRKEGAVAGEFFSLGVRPWVEKDETATPAATKPEVKRAPVRPKKAVVDDLFND